MHGIVLKKYVFTKNAGELLRMIICCYGVTMFKTFNDTMILSILAPFQLQ